MFCIGDINNSKTSLVEDEKLHQGIYQDTKL